MDESPFLPAGNPIPPEAEAVVRDAVRPRTSCEEDASLSSKFLNRDFGLDSPIEPPRASHKLKRGRPIESVIESSSPYGSVDPTLVHHHFVESALSAHLVLHELRFGGPSADRGVLSI